MADLMKAALLAVLPAIAGKTCSLPVPEKASVPVEKDQPPMEMSVLRPPLLAFRACTSACSSLSLLSTSTCKAAKALSQMNCLGLLLLLLLLLMACSSHSTPQIIQPSHLPAMVMSSCPESSGAGLACKLHCRGIDLTQGCLSSTGNDILLPLHTTLKPASTVKQMQSILNRW